MVWYRSSQSFELFNPWYINVIQIRLFTPTIKWPQNDQLLEYFHVIGTVRTSQSCRFQICICCLNRKSNTGGIRENIDDYAHISKIFLIHKMALELARMENFWSISMLLVHRNTLTLKPQTVRVVSSQGLLPSVSLECLLHLPQR